MNINAIFIRPDTEEPFDSYEQYMEYLFGSVNEGMNHYLSGMKKIYATGQGGYKSVLYPDLEVAHDTCQDKLDLFVNRQGKTDHGQETASGDIPENGAKPEEEEWDAEDQELMDLFADFSMSSVGGNASGSEDENIPALTMEQMIDYINARAALSAKRGIHLPFYDICQRLRFENFTVFCLACSILSSTQTDYAGIFQVINENGSLSAPTIESAAKLYYGDRFSITGAYGDMSVCLEQLLPLLNLRVSSSMPFSTVVSPDKRVIDYLFGKNPLRLDENYIRFFQMLTGDDALDPILANEGVLEALEISYGEGVRIFSIFGDEGSGRNFLSGISVSTVICRLSPSTVKSFLSMILSL